MKTIQGPVTTAGEPLVEVHVPPEARGNACRKNYAGKSDWELHRKDIPQLLRYCKDVQRPFQIVGT